MKKIDTKNIDNFIFDMDGTLYSLDGPNCGFSGSSLSKNVEKNCLKYIRKMERCSLLKATFIKKEANKNNVGASVYFSKKYNVTRNDFFDEVWDINPEGIVNEFEIPVSVIKALFKANKNLILLTAAPKIWKKKVLSYLSIDEYFTTKFSGDMFESKSEIFKALSDKLDVSKTLSIGDQLETDIKPAQDLGMSVYWVKRPREVENIWKK